MKAYDGRPVLITGGAGFIGANLADHLLRRGIIVRVLDDLSRPGVDRNLAWLCSRHRERIEPVIADVRHREVLREALEDVSAVFHFAAQTTVAASVVDPRQDFSVNVEGTLEVLEAVRALSRRPAVMFASTSRVYGGLSELAVQLEGSRWRPVDDAVCASGIDEHRDLALRTPFACSKGAADQYVLAYARTYQLPAVVFRLSCVYGPRQLGTADQGWVANSVRRAIDGAPIALHGDGRQVRDVLFIDDLIDAFVRAWTRIDAVRGRAFNLGGGSSNTLTEVELLDLIEQLRGRRPEVLFEPWCDGEPRYYASAVRAFAEATGWRPRIAPRPGVEALHGWLLERNFQPSEDSHA